MAVTVKKISLWRTEVGERAGALADVLEPIAGAGADLRVLMAYRLGTSGRAAVEVYPIAGKKATDAARNAGLAAAAIPALLLEGDNRAGLGRDVSRAVADAGISMGFLIAQVLGRRYSAVFGFDSEADAARAATIIKSAAAGSKRAAKAGRSRR
jgi:ACT domain-containing protein